MNKVLLQLKALAEELTRTYDVIVLNFRGHGGSSGLFTWTSREHIDLLSVVDAFKEMYQKIGVIGFSMGAVTTIIAASKTDLIRSVIAVAAPMDAAKIEYHSWELDFENDIGYSLLGQGRIGKGVRPGPFWLPKEKPINLVEHLKQPIFYIHGTKDWIVKSRHSQALHGTRMYKIFKALFFATILAFIAIAFLYLYPIKTNSLVSHPRPSLDFQESLKRVDDLIKEDPAGIDPAGQAILMHHGTKTKNVIVFFHGFTKSPHQFKALAEQFYQLGYNVYIPRLPHHGFKNIDSASLEKLTAEELIRTSDESMDIGRGLGDHIVVIGISLGAVMAAWTADERDDVEEAVLIAPFLGIHGLPQYFFKPVVNFLMMKPDSFMWWNPEKKENLKVPETTYRGFSSRALGQICRLAWYVTMLAERSPPIAHDILMVTNANDHAVSQEAIDDIIHHWQKWGVSPFRYEFPQSLNIGHDIIDPEQSDQKISVVYPKLLSLIIKKHS